MKMKCIVLSIFVAIVALPSAVFAQSQNAMLDMLRSDDIQLLEESLDKIQLEYNSGHINDIELRNAYRQFYNLEDLS